MLIFRQRLHIIKRAKLLASHNKCTVNVDAILNHLLIIRANRKGACYRELRGRVKSCEWGKPRREPNPTPLCAACRITNLWGPKSIALGYLCWCTSPEREGLQLDCQRHACRSESLVCGRKRMMDVPSELAFETIKTGHRDLFSSLIYRVLGDAG